MFLGQQRRLLRLFGLLNQLSQVRQALPKLVRLFYGAPKTVGYLLHKPGSRQVAIPAAKHGTTVA